MNEPMLKNKLLARLWVAILLTLALVPAAIAGEPTPEKLRELEGKIAEARKKPEQFRSMVALAQMTLGIFGFGTGPFDGVLDEKTRTALRKYQQVRQLPVTGDINAATLSAVERDLDLFLDPPVSLPPLYVYIDLWQQGYVSAQGTWTIVGEKQAYPEQTSQITCDKARGTCLEITAELSKMWNRILSILTTEFTIERWDEYEIITQPYKRGCVAYTIRISRISKAVTGHRMNRPDALEICKSFALTPEFQLKLVNGLDVYMELYRQRGEKIKGLMQAPGLPDKPQ